MAGGAGRGAVLALRSPRSTPADGGVTGSAAPAPAAAETAPARRLSSSGVRNHSERVRIRAVCRSCT